MSNPELDDISTETAGEIVPPTVSTLIAGAMATFDADRNTSWRYLMRASAILQARARPETRKRQGARLRGTLAQWQLNRVVDYIEQHLADRITGEDLARLINLSVGQFFRAFKASVGVTPLHYVVSRRVEFACSLLRTTRNPLSEITLIVGFCDQAHFCRVFKRVLGATPGAWRRANGRDPKPGSTEQLGTVPVRTFARSLYTAEGGVLGAI
jgi:AraC family transcriptional regulator